MHKSETSNLDGSKDDAMLSCSAQMRSAGVKAFRSKSLAEHDGSVLFFLRAASLAAPLLTAADGYRGIQEEDEEEQEGNNDASAPATAVGLALSNAAEWAIRAGQPRLALLWSRAAILLLPAHAGTQRRLGRALAAWNAAVEACPDRGGPSND